MRSRFLCLFLAVVMLFTLAASTLAEDILGSSTENMVFDDPQEKDQIDVLNAEYSQPLSEGIVEESVPAGTEITGPQPDPSLDFSPEDISSQEGEFPISETDETSENEGSAVPDPAPELVESVEERPFVDSVIASEEQSAASLEMAENLIDTEEILTDSETAEFQSASGTCGMNVTWSLDDNGTMTLSGSGPMTDYTYYNIPWINMRQEIKEVVVESGIETIGNYAFYMCYNLADITLPESLVKIGDSAFSSCSITSVSLPSKIETIQSHAFSGCKFTSVNFPNSLHTIGEGAFSACSLTSVVIPENIKTISQSAFSSCQQLTTVTILEGVQAIDLGAFSGCWSLSKIIIPGSVTAIRENSFNDCPGLVSAGPIGGNYNIEFGWKDKIPDNAFWNCSSLTSVSIPAGITSIGRGAFKHTSLTSVILPDGVTTIGSDAFAISSLTKISVPKSVEICDGAFLGASVKTAGPLGGGYDYEFGWVESIPDGAFSVCSDLTNVTLPKGLRKIGNNAFAMTGLQDFIIPGTVSSIGAGAFGVCADLTSVSIGEGVTTIGAHAFSDTGLTLITLPKTIASIGEWAFSNCSALEHVFYGGSESRKEYYMSHGWSAKYNDSFYSANWHYAENTLFFSDVADPSRYYYDPVYWAVENGITVGYGGPNLFSPDVSCTREQIVTFLWRLMGEPEPLSYGRSFVDVPSDKWYYKPIMWAASTGITTGYADGSNKFGVGDPCTREQSVTFLWRAAGKPVPDIYPMFTDVPIGSYYYEAVSWAAGKGITVGLNDGTGRFGVGQSCTRGMIVTFLYRFANGS